MKSTHRLSLYALLALCLPLVAQGPPLATVSDTRQQQASMGDLMRQHGDTPLHIFYVHGIGAMGPDDSKVLRESMCSHLKDCQGQWTLTTTKALKPPFGPGTAPPPLTYWGAPVWAGPDEWNASTPFVQHYAVTRRNGQQILVDDINWWPLTFPLKCRALIASEASLPGPNHELIDLCAGHPHPAQNFAFYPWINNDEASRLNALPARGAKLNRTLKTKLLDWGFGDATLGVGPMRALILEGIRQLISQSVAKHGGMQSSANSQFTIVTHSIGSYLVFAALDDSPDTRNSVSADQTTTTARAAMLQQVLERTPQVYFLANQVSLLELAGLGHSSAVPALASLNHWGELRERYLLEHKLSGTAPQMPQLVAWSDPSDLLTWLVAPLEKVSVLNFEVKNAHHLLWLFEDPTKAHDGYARRPQVLKSLLDEKRPSQ